MQCGRYSLPSYNQECDDPGPARTSAHGLSFTWLGGGEEPLKIVKSNHRAKMNIDLQGVPRSVARHIANLVRFVRTAYLRMLGVKIGRNTMISIGAKIDTHRGTVVIGDNCLITHGAKILSHDGATRLTNPSDNGSGKTQIGNNVFVGVNAVILRNVTIGDNSVVAAGAVVTRNVPPASVVAGNPAEVVKELPGPFQILNNPKHN